MNLKVASFAISSLWILTSVGAVFGQAPAGPPKPGPEHQKLSYFVGKWSAEVDIKASPMGPAGKFSFTENCEWFEGGFAVVCRSDGKMMGMTVKGLNVTSYDPGEKTYTYYNTNTLGETLFSRGMVEGDTWTWTIQSKWEGKPIRGRVTMKVLSPDSATFTFEMASGDEPLKAIMEGKQTRVKG